MWTLNFAIVTFIVLQASAACSMLMNKQHVKHYTAQLTNAHDISKYSNPILHDVAHRASMQKLLRRTQPWPRPPPSGMTTTAQSTCPGTRGALARSWLPTCRAAPPTFQVGNCTVCRAPQGWWVGHVTVRRAPQGHKEPLLIRGRSVGRHKGVKKSIAPSLRRPNLWPIRAQTDPACQPLPALPTLRRRCAA